MNKFGKRNDAVVSAPQVVLSGCRNLGAGVLACSSRQYTFACECGPDSTGEAPDERPWCPQHGVVGFLTPLLGKPYCQWHDEPPINCWELHTANVAVQPVTERVAGIW